MLFINNDEDDEESNDAAGQAQHPNDGNRSGQGQHRASDFLSSGQYKAQLQSDMEAIGRLMDQGGEVSNILTHGNLTPDQLNNGKAGPAGMPSNMANMDDGNSNLKVFENLSNEFA